MLSHGTDTPKPGSESAKMEVETLSEEKPAEDVTVISGLTRDQISAALRYFDSINRFSPLQSLPCLQCWLPLFVASILFSKASRTEIGQSHPNEHSYEEVDSMVLTNIIQI